jgi:effector-binding domain-containing protein
MTVITTEPKIEQRPALRYVAIRSQTTMSEMPTIIPQYIDEVAGWLGEQGIEPDGAPIIRNHACSVASDSAIVDLAVGFPVKNPVTGTERIIADSLPAGRYASLVYTGVENGIAGNAELIEWANQQGMQWDSWDNEIGEAFAGRVEHLLDGPDDDPNPSNWKTEVAIKLAD